VTDLECAEFVEMVTAFLDGTLDAEAEGRVVDHLAGCEGCERYLDQFRRTIGTLGDLPPETPPAEALPTRTREALLAAFRTRAG
jgi:anti-sigma factor RsiW